MISLYRRRVSWKWHVCVAVILGFAVSEWCFRGVEPRCYIGICNAECLLRSSLLRESLVENARFGSLDCHFWWKSRGKCSFRKLGLSLLVKVSWKMLVLEAWIVTFGESLVENARLGSLDCHFYFWWKSRGKCSFWKLGLSLLVKVSWKTLVWKLGLSPLVKVSWNTRVFEAWIVTFGESLVEHARFGSLDCHFWWKSRGKCSFWTKSVKQRLSCQECQAKSVQPECPRKSVKKECQARVSSNFTLHYITLRYVMLRYVTSHTSHRLHTLHHITLHYITLHYTHYITLHYVTLQYTYITLHHIHYIALHCVTLHYITYNTLHYIALHYITLHCKTLTLPYITYITLHCIALHYITLHTLHTLHYITDITYITLHYIALHCSTVHYITSHTLHIIHTLHTLHTLFNIPPHYI